MSQVLLGFGMICLGKVGNIGFGVVCYGFGLVG